jgi:hypothetical protein
MAINEDVRLELDEDAIVFDNPPFDNSIIGVATDGNVVYDYDKMVEELMRDENMSEQDAVDWIEYNTIRSIPYAGEMAPIIMYSFKEGLYG